MTMRSMGSIGAELCEMQRLRDANITLGIKDAEWQRRITTARTPSIISPRLGNSGEPPPPSAGYARGPTPHGCAPSPPPPHPYVTSARPLPAPTAPPVSVTTIQDSLGGLPKRELVELEAMPPPPLPSISTDMLESPPSSPAPSESTHDHSQDYDGASSSGAGRGKLMDGLRGIGKIRRHRMTKEEEARFAPEDLVDLRGSTAAKSRKMSEEERDIMLHKRRLRNRASAARSRDKQRKTIGDVGEEVDELLSQSVALSTRCSALESALRAMRARNEALEQENIELKQNAAASSAPRMKRTGSTLRFSMSSDMLDKIIGSSSEGLLGVSGTSTGMLRIPSKLHVSVSTDKLGDGLVVPTLGTPLQSTGRGMSMLDCLFDYSSNIESSSIESVLPNNSTKNTNQG